MAEKLDYSTLNWVKGEIDETLTQVRVALESYVENPDDETQIRFVVTYLHQVLGTLKMVELYGAVMLAEEMEAVAKALLDKQITQKVDAYEVLMRAILQLPDYLERLQAGNKDVPMVLLPLLNDLRATRGKNLLSENALFSPDLSVITPATGPSAEYAGEDLATVAKTLRHHYQMGLVGWFRDRNVEKSLENLATVLGELRKVAEQEVARQLFWVANGVVEALQGKGLASSVSLKLLLGQVDRQIKRIVDGGEAELLTDAPKDLVKNLLYYAANATSTGNLITEIQSAFALSSLLPNQNDLDSARESMSGLNEDVMESVSAAVKEEMARIKDEMDLFVRGEQHNATKLQPLVSSLKKIADTLGMLGLGVQRNLIVEQAESIDDLAAYGVEPEEDTLLSMARAFLFVESALDDIATAQKAANQAKAEKAIESMQSGNLPDSEFKQLLSAVISEAKTDMARVKNAIVSFINSPWEHEQLAEVPNLIVQIRGSMIMLTLDRAAKLISACNTFIINELIEKKDIPDQETLDTLADAITSTEYYLEALDEDRPDRDSILDIAQRSVQRLGYLPDDMEPLAEERVAAKPDDIVTQVSLASELELEPPELDTPELMSDLTEVVIEDESSADATIENDYQVEVSSATDEAEIPLIEQGLADAEPDETLVFDDAGDILPELQAEPQLDMQQGYDESPAVIEQTAPIPMKPPIQPMRYESPTADNLEDIDDEILEIFLEEADEEIATIQEYFPAWKQNPEDKDSLSTVRRSFHTLKGSGRMVGATGIGEFAWAYENMLNRVIDRTIHASPDMFSLIQAGLDALPSLVEHFKGGNAPEMDINALINNADEMARSGRMPQPEEAPFVPPVVTHDDADITDVMSAPYIEDDARPAPDTTDADDTNDESIIDPVLLDIFTKESSRHLAGIKDFVGQCRQQFEYCSVDDDFIRVVHTLHGSARMAGIMEIADISGLLERLIKIHHKNAVPVSEESCSLFMQIVEAIIQRVKVLDKPDTTLQGKETLTAELTRLIDEQTRLEEQQQEAILNATMAPARSEPVEQTPVVEQPPESAEPQQLEEMATADYLAEQIAADETDDEMPELIAEAFSHPEEQYAETYDSQSEYDQELLEVFIEEGIEILDESETTLHNWINSPEDRQYVEQFQREMHTLKGGARMAGVSAIGDLSHSIETMVIDVVDGRLPVSRDMFDLMQSSHDALVTMIEAVRDNRPVTEMAELIEKINALSNGESVTQTVDVAEPDVEVADAEVDVTADTQDAMQDEPAQLPTEETDLQHEEAYIAESVADTEVDHPEAFVDDPQQDDAEIYVDDSAAVDSYGEMDEDEVVYPEPVFEPLPQADPAIQQVRGKQDQVRIRADLLDNLVNLAGEVSIYRSRIDQQVSAFGYNLTEMQQTIMRLRQQLRHFEIETEAQIMYRLEGTEDYAEEFDPLEMDRFSHMQQLSRSMIESLSDLDSIQNLLDNQSRETETLLLQQSRVSSELQTGLMHTRMVPFSLQLPRLRRLIRQVSKELDKKVELRVYGAEGELDRSVLERIIPPLEHMLRNAVDHGMESQQQRAESGKPETGIVNLRIGREGTEVLIRLEDDGRGINLEAIRRKALERGLIDENSDILDKELLRFITESGFSTAESVTQISGRGVGMDVVNSEIKQLGGSLQIDTEQGKGSTFTIRLPLTLAMNKALMVNVGDETFAIPIMGVEGVSRITVADLKKLYSVDRPRFEYAGNTYRFMHLGSVLGVSSPVLDGDKTKLPVLLIRAGDNRVALQVEGLLGSREIVIKPVGPQISTVPAISGATILGDGRVTLIIDVNNLVFMDIAQHSVMSKDDVDIPVAAPELSLPKIMVVDDSITVRKVTTRLLERNNMHVETGKDGVDALAVLQDYTPDLFLLDIEMPRMDGFELATHIRNDEKLKHIPIIMITSRTGDKHRDRAMAIGVNRYLGKPYQEADLLKNINELLNG